MELGDRDIDVEKILCWVGYYRVWREGLFSSVFVRIGLRFRV